MTDTAAEQTNTDASAGTEAAPTPEQGNTLLAGQQQPPAEGQAAEASGETPGETKPSEDTEQPTEYQDFTIPEGFEVDPDRMASFKDFAQTSKLSQEQAQKALDMYAESLTTAIERYQQAAMDTVAKQQTEWLEQVKADEELGGTKLQENARLAAATIQKFGTPGLIEVLNSSGLGNHPEMVRLAVRIGKAISEDSVVNPSEGSGQAKKAREEILYGT